MKKCWQQQNFKSDPKEMWHVYNHVTFTLITKNFMLYCRLIYMLSMLYVRPTIKVKVGIPESFKVAWYPYKITGLSHFKLVSKYSGTSWYGYLSNTDTSLLQTVSNVPRKFSYIFFKKNLYNTDSF